MSQSELKQYFFDALDENHIARLKAASKINKEIDKLLKNIPTDADLSEEKMFWAQVDALKKQREKILNTRL